MSQAERPVFRRPREGDLERRLRPEYKQYEAWRTVQLGGTATAAVETKEQPKKRAGFGKMDIIFVLVGIIAGLVWQSCNAATPAP